MQAITEREEYAAILQVVREAGLSCLGDVLRSGYQYASLYLSTPTQIQDLQAPVSSLGVKGEMRDWRVISFQLDHPHEKGLQFIVVGDRGKNAISTTTSPVKAIDLAEGLILTQNSVYRLDLAARGEGEPSLKQLVCLCRTLHSWGLGRAFDVPRV